MRTEIVQYSGDLKREVWEFSLGIGHISPCIYFDHYSFQTRESSPHKNWVKQTHWARLDHRTNNIDSAPLPQEIESEMRSRYQEYIMKFPIVS